jgi:hypothetical protein
MGLFLRRRRPIARLAAGAATAGVAYHAGKRHAEQDAINDQATSAYQATQGGPDPDAQPPQYASPQYAPPPPVAAPPNDPDSLDNTAQLEKIVQLHTSGALTDAEFTAAKARLLGL